MEKENISLTESQLKAINDQIESETKPVSFDMKEFTVEFYVNKYLDGVDKDDNELYVPDYQREFVWDDTHQSRFIESLILGLPIPFIFASEIKKTGKLEIVDGSQRIRTMAAYLNDNLVLTNLKKLTNLNNTHYEQLPSSLKRKIKNTTIRMIVLSSKATSDVRTEMFDRINTSSVPLLPMEKRRGIFKGKFTDFIIRLANNQEFRILCPLNKYLFNRREEEELVLRFFAFMDAYPYFRKIEEKGVANYLDWYLNSKNNDINEDELKEKEDKFLQMISFIKDVYPKQGFAKAKNTVGISKPYFEALAIGVSLAFQENQDLKKEKLKELSVKKENRNEFYNLVSGRYKTHTAKKILDRINYVKNIYLNNNGS